MVIQEYRELLAGLSEKYGKPEKSAEAFLEPYRKGDGYETTAIRVGKGIFVARWMFPAPNGKPNALVIQITDTLQIRATYESGELITLLGEKNKRKAREDY